MPLSADQRNSLEAFALVVAVFVVLIVLVVVTTTPTPEKTTQVGSTSFFYENETIAEPGWSNYSFLGHDFEFHAWCSPITPGGVSICGNVSEPMGATAPFSFWMMGPGFLPPIWLSPDGQDGVRPINTSGGFSLLVAV